MHAGPCFGVNEAKVSMPCTSGMQPLLAAQGTVGTLEGQDIGADVLIATSELHSSLVSVRRLSAE